MARGYADHVMPTQKTEKVEAIYANHFKIGHNAYEFVIDFGQCYSEKNEAEIYIRIVTNPAYAKALRKILTESIDQYEKKYSTIQSE